MRLSFVPACEGPIGAADEPGVRALCLHCRPRRNNRTVASGAATRVRRNGRATATVVCVCRAGHHQARSYRVTGQPATRALRLSWTGRRPLEPQARPRRACHAPQLVNTSYHYGGPRAGGSSTCRAPDAPAGVRPAPWPATRAVGWCRPLTGHVRGGPTDRPRHRGETHGCVRCWPPCGAEEPGDPSAPGPTAPRRPHPSPAAGQRRPPEACHRRRVASARPPTCGRGRESRMRLPSPLCGAPLVTGR